MTDNPTARRRPKRGSRAIYFWIAIGVFVAVLLAASAIDPFEPEAVQAAPPADR